MSLITEFRDVSWEETGGHEEAAIYDLERGKVLYFPSMDFPLTAQEQSFCNPQIVDPRRKNVSYDLRKDQLGGTVCTGKDLEGLRLFLRRYAESAEKFVKVLFPHYRENLIVAKTSFRPVEIEGRISSVCKDDKRLHIDAFPSNPIKGLRLLRFFTNVNPEGKARLWRVGEPFEEVVRKFAPQVAPPFPGSAALLKFLKITKDKRTVYDHYMLGMHNKMKEDETYQTSVQWEERAFPSKTSWMVYTDQVSHAALTGQHLLEQTFYLPYTSMEEESTAPIRVLEKYLQRSLVSV